MRRDGGQHAVRRVVGVVLDATVEQVATVPQLEPGTAHRLALGTMVPGGRSAAVVRAVRSLGLDGELVAVLGGPGGAWYRDAVSRAGIALHEVAAATATPRSLSIMDEAAGVLTTFEDAAPHLDPGDWPRVEEALGSALGSAVGSAVGSALAGEGEGEGGGGGAPAAGDTVVVLAGPLPAGAPADAYRRLATLAARAGARVAVDLAGDPFGAVVQAAPWLVTVDLAAAGAILGLEGADDPVAAGRALVRRGAGTAIVTLGLEGAVLVTRDWAWRLGPAPRDRLGPFTPGAADAFLAGWLSAVARGDDALIGLRRAGAAWLANSQRPGQGELDPGDVAAAIAAFNVEPVDR